jgi:hypothetical protein
MDEKPRNRRLRFGLRTLFEVIAVLAFILTLVYYRQTVIQNTGRYQQLKDEPPSNPPRVLVIDTHTGHVWGLSGDRWTDYGEPARPTN